ncbi:hypothetical protein GCM10027443_17530 [Pontibacter brevis]
MKLINYFVVLYATLLVSCQPKEEHALVKNEFFTEEGLKKWNTVTDAALDSFTASYGESFMISYIENSLNQSNTNSLNEQSVLLRESYIDSMRRSDSVGDSIPYDSAYIVELHMSGEETFIGKYLIIEKGDSASYFFTRYAQGGWLPLRTTEDKACELNRFISEVPSHTEKSAFGGLEEFVIITKFAGEEVTAKVFTSLSWDNTSWLMDMLPNSLQIY